jgi:hypothetical protein
MQATSTAPDLCASLAALARKSKYPTNTPLGASFPDPLRPRMRRCGVNCRIQATFRRRLAGRVADHPIVPDPQLLDPSPTNDGYHYLLNAIQPQRINSAPIPIIQRIVFGKNSRMRPIMTRFLPPTTRAKQVPMPAFGARHAVRNEDSSDVERRLPPVLRGGLTRARLEDGAQIFLVFEAGALGHLDQRQIGFGQ